MDRPFINDPTRAAPTSAPSVAADQPLQSFCPASHSGPAVVTLSAFDVPVVVLRATSVGTIEVLPVDGPIVALPGEYHATPVTDPDQRAACLAGAVTELLAESRYHVADLDRARAEIGAARHHHATELATIRRHAIRWHNAGDIRRDDLDAFLNELDLPAYQPRVRISYTITGTYRVTTTDIGAALRDAENFLAVNVESVSHVVHGSRAADTVAATGADCVDRLTVPPDRAPVEAAHRPNLRIHYAITGAVQVDTADALRAARDAKQHLDVDLRSVDNVVAGSSTCDVRITAVDAFDV